MSRKSLLAQKNRIETILRRAEDRESVDLIRDLRAFATEIGDDAGEALLYNYPELFVYSPVLTAAFRAVVVSADKAECETLLSMQFDRPVRFPEVASKQSVSSYNRTREIFDLVDFHGCAKVVMVGCGHRPFTAFHMRDKTTVPEIVGLDVLPDAVESAAKLSNWLGYADLMFQLCDGSRYDYSGVGVVYVASMLTGKIDIMRRIVETAPDDTRIIVCEPYSLGRLWGESIERDLDPRLDIVHTGKRGYWSLTRELLLMRRATAARRAEC